MILLALAQAAAAILIGVVLLMRGKRGFGWTLIAIGAAIVVLAMVYVARFTP